MLDSEDIIMTLKENNDVLIKYVVKEIELFGSFARGEQKDYSDI